MYGWLYAFSEDVRVHGWIFGAGAVLILLAEVLWVLIGGSADEPGFELPDARKEQLKLRATMFNNLAVAIFTIGVLSPLVAALYKLVNAPKYDDIVNLSGAWLAAGIAFHFFGALILAGIR